MKSTLTKTLDNYFATKEFEKDGKIYEILGVKYFGRYFPNFGSFWTKKFKEYPSMINGYKKKDLNKFINLTRRIEGGHLIALPLWTSLNIYHFMNKDYESLAIFGGINILINVYPIMSQRYNRNRALRFLEKKQ